MTIQAEDASTKEQNSLLGLPGSEKSLSNEYHKRNEFLHPGQDDKLVLEIIHK